MTRPARLIALGAALGATAATTAQSPTTQPAPDTAVVVPTTQPARQTVPSASEVLDQLLKTRPKHQPIEPVEPGVEVRRSAAPSPSVSPNQDDLRLLPDGSMLVDRPGRLVREGDGWTFVIETAGEVVRERPLRLLPCRMLEQMEIAAAGGTAPVIFVVSGEVTEYRGANYLLLRKLLVRRDMGNVQ